MSVIVQTGSSKSRQKRGTLTYLYVRRPASPAAIQREGQIKLTVNPKGQYQVSDSRIVDQLSTLLWG